MPSTDGRALRFTGMHAVVTDEENDGVVSQFQALERGRQLTHQLVHVVDVIHE